jgi:quercetin dioxygenase-like cupin family protein
MNRRETKSSSAPFVYGRNETPLPVAPGVSRQLLGYDASLLMARAEFEQGAVGYRHAHPHAQVTYVESGVFDFTIGDETGRLEAGDCAYIPSGIEHGAVCVQAGALLDVFAPAREDFLAEHQKT